MDWNEVTTRQEAVQYCEDNGAEVRRLGRPRKGNQVTQISTVRGSIRTTANDRTMDKDERETWRFWLWGLGIPTCIVIGLLIWAFRQQIMTALGVS